ncbi:hypothetical protein HYALB_00011837 [Hymenoscyphus albidus]|uniref:RBR-type E3 ubiquitin transferase n=1 Tax=Hymenoscyphus albidus TaxID=595503 RepID=A0A9N9LWV2_9HELO|nr:hypothetical protein HYALB_00011837 [Hymenoscyphus albidus]
MAHSDGGRRRVTRRHSYSDWDDGPPTKSSGKERVTLEREIPGVRRVRVERQDADEDIHRRASHSKMNSESYATLPSQKSTSRRRRRHHHESPEDGHRRRRRDSNSRGESPASFHDGRPSNRSRHSRTTPPETKKHDSESETSESEKEIVVMSRKSESIKDPPKVHKIRIVRVSEEEYRAAKTKEHILKSDRKSKVKEVKKEDETLRRSRSHRPRRASEGVVSSSPRRTTSTREVTVKAAPALKRSHTTSSHVPSTKHAPSLGTTSTHATNRRSTGLLSTFFAPVVQQRHEPERLVECLTCLSGDIPRSKSAKLKCGHRMCHSCLKRIFKLSVTDPQHMPPKCCTADFIPLKHVDRLFNNDFKRNWNRKFQEYSTKNRIYCPQRRCGEWIKPGNIHKEDGKKLGKCSRCKTKVCCLCNGKWHGSRDCPKDEETNKLLAAAKDAGWQRCYSCRTMVELKEGCNHMTCRCTAEFCMCCGLKWKTCNCPWFNYEAVEEDRLNHMQVPQEIHINQNDPPPPPPPDRPPIRDRLRRPRPNTYYDEINERQRQEREDEALARRLQNFNVDEHDDDYQGGIGDIHGIGNAAGHFMNDNYVRVAHNLFTGTLEQASAAANYVLGVRQARGGPPPPPSGVPRRRMSDRYPAVPPPAPVPPVQNQTQNVPPATAPPVLRRHTLTERRYNTAASTRPSERVVPRRERTDYEAEAAVHMPLPYTRRMERKVSTRGVSRVIPERTSAPRTPEREARQSERSERSPKTSVLAGLGSGRGNNRVQAWRNHVSPGLEVEEGVLGGIFD